MQMTIPYIFLCTNILTMELSRTDSVMGFLLIAITSLRILHTQNRLCLFSLTHQ